MIHHKKSRAREIADSVSGGISMSLVETEPLTMAMIDRFHESLAGPAEGISFIGSRRVIKRLASISDTEWLLRFRRRVKKRNRHS